MAFAGKYADLQGKTMNCFRLYAAKKYALLSVISSQLSVNSF